MRSTALLLFQLYSVQLYLTHIWNFSIFSVDWMRLCQIIWALLRRLLNRSKEKWRYHYQCESVHSVTVTWCWRRRKTAQSETPPCVNITEMEMDCSLFISFFVPPVLINLFMSLCAGCFFRVWDIQPVKQPCGFQTQFWRSAETRASVLLAVHIQCICKDCASHVIL